MLAPHSPAPRRRRRFAVLAAACSAGLAAALFAYLALVGEIKVSTTAKHAEDDKVVGYFTEEGFYRRDYYVRNVQTSGSAARLTHLVYAFGNVVDGRCVVGDPYAAYGKTHSAAQSVDGVADRRDQPLRGNINQLRKLKRMYPHLKVLWSFGGWEWSRGFARAAKDPATFAASCHRLVKDPRWADVFDGIDIDWEYPNACGLSCDTSGRNAFGDLMREVRKRFGGGSLVTAAVSTDSSKIDATDYAGAAKYVDWYDPMTYDFFGAWDERGPTAPHSPLTSYRGMPRRNNATDAAIGKLKSLGIPSRKLLLGIGFYGRGWTGVTQTVPGGRATGPAPGSYEKGIAGYRVLKARCPVSGTVAGTAYAHCGNQWWSYDTPSTIAGKMAYKRREHLGGTFFWELSGDTPDGELIKAID